jgi:hypothetical protein
MIQRIQTIWLLISALCSGLLVKNGIIDYIDISGQKYFTGFSGIIRLNSQGHELIAGSIPLSAIIILIPVLSVVSILLFKSRRFQKIITLIIIAFSLSLIILVIYYSYIVIKNYNAELVPGIKMVLPLIILIAATLAYKGISKDEKLVKSYDRLR